MSLEEYDAEFGYSIRELGQKYSLKAYELQPHERDTILEVTKGLENGSYEDYGTVLEHLGILNSLLKRIGLIALSEERTGLVNWELKSSIEEVKVLCSKLTKLSASLPRIKVYGGM
jgi:hypothetical protein